MSVTLTVELEARIRHWIETGQSSGADALIVEALDALEAQEQAWFFGRRASILVGRNSGEGAPNTRELTDEAEREAEQARTSVALPLAGWSIADDRGIRV